MTSAPGVPHMFHMPDDSRLRDHARDHRLRYEWRTWRDGTHWHAEARLWRGGQSIAWFGTSTREGEQRALDLATDLVIGPPLGPDRVEERINLVDPARPPRRPTR